MKKPVIENLPSKFRPGNFPREADNESFFPPFVTENVIKKITAEELFQAPCPPLHHRVKKQICFQCQILAHEGPRSVSIITAQAIGVN